MRGQFRFRDASIRRGVQVGKGPPRFRDGSLSLRCARHCSKPGCPSRGGALFGRELSRPRSLLRDRYSRFRGAVGFLGRHSSRPRDLLGRRDTKRRRACRFLACDPGGSRDFFRLRDASLGRAFGFLGSDFHRRRDLFGRRNASLGFLRSKLRYPDLLLGPCDPGFPIGLRSLRSADCTVGVQFSAR